MVAGLSKIPEVKATGGISLIQGYNYGSASSIVSGTFTVTQTSAPTSGDTNILGYLGSQLSGNSNPRITGITQTGVTWYNATKINNAAYFDSEIWYGNVGASAGNVITVTVTGGYSGDIAYAGVVEWRGLTANPLDKTATLGSGQTGAPATGITGTISYPLELCIGTIAAIYSANYVAQSNPTNNFTLLDGVSHAGGSWYYSMGYLYNLTSATGTYGSSVSTETVFGQGAIATFIGSSQPTTASVTFASNPTGSGFITINGSAEATPFTFTQGIGGTDTITANSPVSLNGNTYSFSSWSDSGAQSHTYTVPNGGGTVTASFIEQTAPLNIVQSPSIVAYTNSSMAVRFGQKEFYSNGNYWIFYNDVGYSFGGEDLAGVPYYVSSPNGVTWSTPNAYFASELSSIPEWEGEDIQVLYANGFVYAFVRQAGAGIYFCQGTPESNGVIDWLTSWQEIALDSGGANCDWDFDAVMSSTGNLWVTWAYSTTYGGTAMMYAWQDSTTNNDGTWATTAGFPIEISPEYGDNNFMTALPNGQILFVYFEAGVSGVYSKLWNGASLGDQVTITTDTVHNDYSPGLESYSKDLISDASGNAYLTFINSATNIEFLEYQSTGIWSSEQTIQSDVTNYATPSLFFLNGILYSVWLNSMYTLDYAVYNLASWAPNATPLITNTLAFPGLNPNERGILDGWLNVYTQVLGSGAGLLYTTNITDTNVPTKEGANNYLYQINFALIKYPSLTITASCDSHSTISPSGVTTLPYGNSQTFTYSASADYNLGQVLVDGSPISLVTYPSSYTFSNIQISHTIAVSSVLTPTIVSNPLNPPIVITPGPASTPLPYLAPAVTAAKTFLEKYFYEIILLVVAMLAVLAVIAKTQRRH
jgi:hypothetical protein